MSSTIHSRLETIKSSTKGRQCTLVAVSKTKPNEVIMEAYEAGQRDFGENKVQDLVAKAEALPTDIKWHMIGHLQRNKVKYIVPFVHLIHGIDSEKLLKEINKEAAKINRTVNGLLQVHIAKEDTKFGFSAEELNELASNDGLSKYPNVKVQGLMGMATFTDNKDQVAEEFSSLKAQFDRYNWDTLSMGMSGDYLVALEQGSNMIRVGTAIFGERNY
jgi:pyridoxal phosphate enzyme (YggS family)